MTQIGFIIKSALRDFYHSKVRTVLTSLGILIGVASVVLLLAFGLGLRAYISNQFESLGSNLLFVIPGQFSGAGFRPGTIGGVRFDERDLQLLRKLSEADKVVGVFTRTIKAGANGRTETSDVFATTPEIFVVRNLTIEYGKVFDKSDESKRKKVAVIGPKLAEKLFDDKASAVGKNIDAGGTTYLIIGVLTSKGGGGLGGPDFDSFVYVPHSSALQFNPQKNYISFYLKVKNEDDVAMLKEKAKLALRKNYKEDEYSVVEQTEVLNTIQSIFGVLNSILVAIGAISLIVGGVGIMNIMYVTVTERIKEIGVRRAIGATKRDILLQFLTEATILSLIGGIMGLVVSAIVVALVQPFFPAYIDPQAVAIALGVSSGVGIIFGVFPAKKAADLSPIEAIRYE